MKISIVTVCYNEEKNIAKTIESVLNQTSNSFEYIICDGKSADKTVEIAESYADKFKEKGVEYRVYSERDGGIYAGMNNGIDRSDEDYVIFINAGDKLNNDNSIKNVIEAVGDNYPEVIYGNCLYVDMCVCSVFDTDHTKLENGMSMAHPSTLVRSDVIKNHKFDTSFKIAADYNMMLTLYQEKRDFLKIDVVISNFYADGVSSINRCASTAESCRVKKLHGIECNEELELAQARKIEKKIKFKRRVPKAIRKFWSKTIKKRNWLDD